MSQYVERDLSETSTAEFVYLEQQVARFFESRPRVEAQVDVAGLTDTGKVRKTNEDHFLAVRRYRGRQVLAASTPEGMFESGEDHAYTLTVADGMGGRDFGELASLMALRTGWELGGDEIKWTVKLNEQEGEELRQKGEVFFKLINRVLHRQAREHPRMTGMGTTLTMCYTLGRDMFVMHAGDSRAYLYRRGVLKRLTRDHNMAQVLVDSGVALPDAPEVRRMRHVLTNCLGGPSREVAVDIEQHTLEEEDRILLCTDGLNDMVTDLEIAQLLDCHSVSADACRALVDLALQRGGRDNITVLVARYQFTDRIP